MAVSQRISRDSERKAPGCCLRSYKFPWTWHLCSCRNILFHIILNEITGGLCRLTSWFHPLFESTKNQEIIKVGLDAVGKTIIFNILKGNQELLIVSKRGFNIEECQIKIRWQSSRYGMSRPGQDQAPVGHILKRSHRCCVCFWHIIPKEKWREAAEHLMKVMDKRRLPTLNWWTRRNDSEGLLRLRAIKGSWVKLNLLLLCWNAQWQPALF